MARIRTIKPEFFRHEVLQDLEIANPGKYPMMVFSGLWVIADREGRFEWRPRRIKLDVLPFLEFDMEETLSLLEEIGLVIRYVHDGEVYGAIVSWERHQVVGRDEPPSEIPAPDGSRTPYFRPLNQTQRFKVYERDNWTCAYCSRDMRNDKRAACLDHVVPYSKGGTNRAENLVTCCKKCNAAKSDKTPSQAGFNWPNGLGEYLDKDTNTVRQHTVNTPLTGGPAGPDKEGVKEKEKGREREEEGKGVVAAPIESIPENLLPIAIAPATEKQETVLQAVCRQTWAAYADAYERRYGAAPVRNAKVSTQVKTFVQRIGHDESLSIAEWFVSHPGGYYVSRMHDFGCLLNDAEKLRTEWATGRVMTQGKARQSDRTGTNGAALAEVLAELGDAA